MSTSPQAEPLAPRHPRVTGPFRECKPRYSLAEVNSSSVAAVDGADFERRAALSRRACEGYSQHGRGRAASIQAGGGWCLDLTKLTPVELPNGQSYTLPACTPFWDSRTSDQQMTASSAAHPFGPRIGTDPHYVRADRYVSSALATLNRWSQQGAASTGGGQGGAAAAGPLCARGPAVMKARTWRQASAIATPSASRA